MPNLAFERTVFAFACAFKAAITPSSMLRMVTLAMGRCLRKPMTPQCSHRFYSMLLRQALSDSAGRSVRSIKIRLNVGPDPLSPCRILHQFSDII